MTNEWAVAFKKQAVRHLSWLRIAIKAIAASPTRLFFAFAAVHLLIWTIVPALVAVNAPLDVIENYAWVREWLMGTHKHPPMQGWWIEIFAMLTGRAGWAHYLASQVAIVIAFWAVWQTGRRMLGDKPALVGVLLLEGVIYYNFTSPEFNANILQLPFWALACWSFHRAVKDNRLTDWLLLGLWCAAGLFSKYSTVLLLATFGILILAHKEGRRRLKTPGPYLALLTAAVLFIPHAVWLMNHHYLPFNYARNQMKPLHHDLFLLTGLVSGQLAALLPAALLFFGVFSRRSTEGEDRLHSFDRAFLGAITFGPFWLTFLLALFAGFKIRDMWATPFWNFIGVWAMFYFPPKLNRESLQRFAVSWSIVALLSVIIYGGIVLYGPYITGKTLRVHFPGRALAEKVADGWHRRYHKPLEYVVGDIWPAGNVAYYTPERPHVLIMGDYMISPWIDQADFAAKGGVIVWCVRYCIGRGHDEPMPAFIHEKFPQADIQPEFELQRETGADVKPTVMQWAFLAPVP